MWICQAIFRSLAVAGLLCAAGAARALPVEPAGEHPAEAVLGDALEPGDAALYGRIFELQRLGRIPEADHQIALLSDPVLMGHVLAQRYLHPTAYVSSFDELRAWLQTYGDHPQAERIYRLAQKKAPTGAGELPRPVKGYLGGAGQEQAGEAIGWAGPRPTERSEADRAAIKRWQDGTIELLSTNDHSSALKRIDTGAPAGVDRVERELLRWRLAHDMFVAGKGREALALASRAAAAIGDVEPRTHWTAGLAAWSIGQKGQAADHFVRVLAGRNVPKPEATRAAFWAARALVAIGNRDTAIAYFARAAAAPTHFYGQLAASRLGSAAQADREDLRLTQTVRRGLQREAGAKRAVLLAQIGEDAFAEQELRKIAPRADARLGHALLALAQSLDLPATQMRLAQFLAETRGMQLEAGLLPMPDWRPPGATPLVDRALVYAVIRAESAFDADARSPAGARGVMQLMPGTAEAVAALEGVQLFSKDDLFEPALNVQLGEAYLAHLLETGGVGGNLVKLAAAYNAGPARIAAWQDLPRAADDPLLFIEAIPIGETRRYVKNVLTNFWRYRLLLAQPVGSRDDLARGRWPHYVALDGTKIADGGH